jgi:hypothetical protein
MEIGNRLDPLGIFRILALCAILAITGFYTDQQLLFIAMDGYGQISKKWEGGSKRLRK